MDNYQISVGTLAAWTLWIAGGALVVSGIFLSLPAEVGLSGLLVAGLGHLLAIRRMFARLQQRERAAFELGRDSVRSVR